MKEAAKSAKELRGEGLALFFKRNGKHLTAFLYDGNAVMKAFLKEYHLELKDFEVPGRTLSKAAKKEIAGEVWGSLLYSSHTSSQKVGRAMISGEWNSSCKAFEVKFAAAKNKYGPFMYDMAASTFGWIVSDRSSTSSAAKRIWGWMHSHPEAYNTRQVADFTDLDDDIGPAKPCAPDVWAKPSKKQIPLFFAYSPKTKKQARTKAVANNHKKVVAALRQYGISKNYIDEYFDTAGEELFQSLYG